MIIKLKVAELNEQTAKLVSESQESIDWPKSRLPEKTVVGSILYFQVSLEEEAGQDNPGLAKEILNEIIGIDNAAATD